MRRAIPSPRLIRSCLCLALFALAACGDDDASDGPGFAGASGAERGALDAAARGGGADAGAPDCFEQPRTHAEIINACTDAAFVDKEPELPLLLPDGGLPPLP